MGERISAWWGAHKPTRRKLIQFYCALLYNAHLKGLVKGDIFTGATKNLCVPGFNCYSCPGAIGACPLGALQNALASSSNRAPYYILGILSLYGLLLGRTICGWLCPLGLIQELLYLLPTPKLRKNVVTRALSWLKYVVLAVFVIAVPLAYSVQHFPVPAFCKYICPAGTSEGAMLLLANPGNADKFSMLHLLFTRKFCIMVIIFTACIFLFRAFCRFLCPLGAIYGLFSRVALTGVRVEPERCTHCGRCEAHCKMDIRRVGDHECIHCGECISVCPTQAIRMQCGGVTLLKAESPAEGAVRTGNPRRLRVMLAGTAALLLLAGALWYANRPEATQAPPEQAASSVTSDGSSTAAQSEPSVEAESVAVGSEVGMRCPSFSVPLYGAKDGSFTFEPGKVTVINFWATWCTPCVQELPYFQQLSDAYGEDISIVAIHSDLVTDDVESFLGGEAYTFPFALDKEGDVITSLGGSTMLPMTVVVDASGVIVYNQTGSVTYEKLDSLVSPLLSES